MCQASDATIGEAILLEQESTIPDLAAPQHVVVQIMDYRPYVPQRLVVLLTLLDSQTGTVVRQATATWTGQDVPPLTRAERPPRWRRGKPRLQPGDEVARISMQEFWLRAARDIAAWIADNSEVDVVALVSGATGEGPPSPEPVPAPERASQPLILPPSGPVLSAPGVPGP